MLEKKLEQLGEYSGEDQVISSQEILVKLKDQPESIINVKSFIPSLDDYIDGFKEGELITISGPTKQGKTLLAQSFTISFQKQQYYALWFSFEVPYRQFLNQFHAVPLIYMPQTLKPHAMEWFEERVWESFQKYHTRIIIIDHLHYLVDLAKARNPSIEIGQIIRDLKTLAREGQFVIFLLTHTKKGSNEDNLSYDSIRDSSFISQESDCVLMIKRTPKQGENTARLRVEFHRRTGVFEKIVNLIKHNGYLVELENEDKYEPKQYKDD